MAAPEDGAQDVLERLRELREASRRRQTSDLPDDAPERISEPASSTAVRQIRTQTPAGGGLILDPQTGEARSASEPRGTIARSIDALRQKRDVLLNQTLANNPLQEFAAPYLGAVAGLASEMDVTDEVTALDVLANIGKGSAIGSILIPDDAAVDPENPMPAVQLISTFIGAGAEGFVGEASILRGLFSLSKARAGTNIGKSAEKALRAFGQGEDLGIGRKIVGGGLLAGTAEIGLQAGGLQDPADILKASGLVTVGGAALGGAVASVSRGVRAARATPRALRAFSEEFAEKAVAKGKPPTLAQAEESSLFKVSAKTPIEESGVGRLGEMIQRSRQAVEEAQSVRTRATPPERIPSEGAPKIRLQDDDLESLFDLDTSRTFLQRMREGFDAATEAFDDAFIFEAKMQKFPSMTGVDELTLGDDFRVLQASFQRAPRLATKELRNLTAPLRESFSGEDFTEAWKAFERTVFLRDFVETADRGLPLPKGVSKETVEQELRALETVAPREALDAADAHQNLVNRMREELIRRGKLDVGSGFDHYVPHVVLEDLARADADLVGDIDPSRLNYFTGRYVKGGKLQEPSRPQTRQRRGSERQISTDYTQIMYRALRRFHIDNAVDDFLSDANETFGLSRSDLSEGEKAALNRVGRFKRGDEEFRIFQPTGPRYFPAKTVDEESFNVLRSKIQEEMDVDISDLPDVRNVLGVGRRKEFILPAEISERLDQFYAPKDLLGTGLPAGIRKGTSWWKRNTIFWGMMRFSVFQILGDGINALRSNPQAILQIKNGRLDSPTVRAVNEIFKSYGTPTMSPAQMFGTLGGGVGGLTINEIRSGDEDSSMVQRVASVLAGAGLGYIAGTRRVRGSLHTTSDLYDTADEFAAVNSGFVFQEEDLSRRILGEEAGRLPVQQREPWQRTLDTVFTLLSGKTKGDPFALARVPAEVVEVFQNERENVLRLASYMQQVEGGVDPRVAAKRAREALVDYGKFTDTENKLIRGFMLPFYSFYRHNIPNWVKASLGKDVGGKTKVAFAAAAGIATADVVVQAWNETFFPEVERALDDFRRKRFHIIMGNPSTGETYTDVEGKPMVVGWEMPYEQALELFGLARPGYVLSQLFGIGGERERVDLFERGRRTAEDLATLKPVRDFAIQLLSPVIKEPIQVAMNKDLFFNAPIVPERYVGTPEGKKRMLNHAAETFFRQFREAKRTAGEVSGRRFDPLTSTFGLGLPVTRVDLDRDLQGFLHEQMQATADETAEIQAPWKTRIDDLIYDREEFSRVPEGEPQEALEVISEFAESGPDREAAWRYYMNRGGKGSLERHWGALSSQEKVRFVNALPSWGRTAFFFYMNGGQQVEEAAPSSALPGFLGN